MRSTRRSFTARLSRGRVLLALVCGVLLTVAVMVVARQAAVPPVRGSPSRAEVRALLSQVPVVDARRKVPGYQRSCSGAGACSFGPAWADAQSAPDGHNGCDTRNDVLGEQLTEVVRARDQPCVVTAGTLADPYLGRLRTFRRAAAREIQIDHVFPLAAAWDLGAAQWDQPRREAFANDTRRNLLAVDAGVNQAKSDGTPSAWLPPEPALHCWYAGKYLTVAVYYRLALTKADVEVLTDVADRC